MLIRLYQLDMCPACPRLYTALQHFIGKAFDTCELLFDFILKQNSGSLSAGTLNQTFTLQLCDCLPRSDSGHMKDFLQLCLTRYGITRRIFL